MLEYYLVLRTVLRSKPALRSCLTRCSHCRIFFLADPRNRGRRDLGCPFGCREALRRKRSSERSTAYNRSPAGKLKRKLRKRRRADPPPEGEAGPSKEEGTAAGGSSPEIGLAPALLAYLRVAVSLIEGRRVSGEEMLQTIRRLGRQRSFARERRIDYVVRTLKERPP